MSESNHEILGVEEGASAEEIQRAFRQLALRYHSDRGGDEEVFKRIKRAYDDLRAGRARSEDDAERGGEDAIRRNVRLAREVEAEMRAAQEWIDAVSRAGECGARLFGSKSLGEIELERKANGALSIRGNFMAGTLRYSGPITLQGGVTSPTRGGGASEIVSAVGDFRVLEPLANRYRIENGARVTAMHGSIIAGNVFGAKRRVPDPDGRIGVYTDVEFRTRLSAPNGSIRVNNAAGTVELAARGVEANNLRDDVRIAARDVSIHGSTVTHDVVIRLAEGGTLRFYEAGSVLGISDDAKVLLENGSSLSLHELKVKKIRDMAGAEPGADKNQTLVGRGYAITYSMIDRLASPRGGLASRLGLR